MSTASDQNGALRIPGALTAALALEWPRELAAARAMQTELAARVVEVEGPGEPATVAGVDCHFDASRNLTYAAVAVLGGRSLDLEASVLATRPLTFRYLTGLLSFRETPAVLDALSRLERMPDLLFVDGHGRAHPRRFGLACHIGVLADLPTIGVAKSRLVGDHPEPGPDPGDVVPLEHKGELIGIVLRTRPRGRPLYISVGHKVTLDYAVRRVMACLSGRYRLPEPTRVADRLSRCHG